MSDGLTDALGKPRTSPVRVGLTLAGIVLAAVLIFGLGVLEGSRVAELVPAAAPPANAPSVETAAIPPPAPATPAPPIPADKLTFYDRLSGVAPAVSVPLPEGQPVAPEAAPAPSSAPRPAARRPEPAPPATPVATPEKVAAPVVARTEVPSKPDPAARIRKLSGKGRFAVQVAAVSERAAAARAADLIKSNGFEAVTVMASVKGKIWYRIRVGSFPSKAAATEAAGVFRSIFGLDAIPVEN